MKFLLRPLVAIITFTISLLIVSITKTFFFDDETKDYPVQTGTSFTNYSGQVIVHFQPDEYPAIINSTEALEVKGLAKSLGRYQLSLKNNSSKNVVAYYLSVDKRNIEAHGDRYGNRRIVIAAGKTYQEDRLGGKEADFKDITIHTVVFDDDSFEGDLNLAAQIVARREGIRLQSTPVLQMIDRTLAVDDANLLHAFDELETELGVMPETINKVSALELLSSKYPCFDKRMIGSLYEYLKMGLYEGKNMAHCSVGNMQRYLKGLKADSTSNKNAVQGKVIREKLNEIKKNFEPLSRRG